MNTKSLFSRSIQASLIKQLCRGRLEPFSALVPILLILGTQFMAILPTAAEWPSYRHDSRRSAVSSEALPANLHLQWAYHPMHAPEPAWPLPGEETPRMHSDRSFHVVVNDDNAYFGSAIDNKVIALNVLNGTTRWTFFAGGSVRFAPVLNQERLYFGADDGLVYCLDARTGKQVWTYRPSPSGECVIGNGRMVSLWPIRTGLLVEEGVVYLAAGVFPYEGLYIVAVDAETGKEIWKNDTAGDLAWGLDYGGMAPQGYLLASEEVLYVPSGRAMPAAFDRKTGKFLRFLSTGGKIGGSWALLDEGRLIAGVNNQGTPAKIAYSKTGRRVGDLFASFPGRDMVLTPKISYTITEDGMVAIDREKYQEAAAELPKIEKRRKELGVELTKARARILDLRAAAKVLESKEDEASQTKLKSTRKDVGLASEQLSARTHELADLVEQEKRFTDARILWKYARRDLHTVALAGDTLVGGGDGFVVTIEAATGKPGLEAKLDGMVMDLAIAGGRLFATTDRGPVHCFGTGTVTTPPIIQPKTVVNPFPRDKFSQRYKEAAHTILEESGISLGFALVLNAGEGRLAFELARQSKLNIVALQPDPELRRRARERLDACGLYGARVIVEDWGLADLPDYFANLITSDRMVREGVLSGSSSEMFRVLRPSGGVVLLGHPDATPRRSFDVTQWLDGSGAPVPQSFVRAGHWWKVTRGKLEGAADWTHLYGNAANTGSIPDDHVRGPFGVLWYGEPGSQHMLDRHARSVSPLAAHGRLFVQGAELVQAFDAYNGTMLWERKIPGAVRVRVDVDGGNLSATSESLYVATHEKTFRLDAQTGETRKVFTMPSSQGGDARRWGYIAATENILFGSAAIPLSHDYGFIWKELVVDGRWKKREEIPEPQRQAIYGIKARDGTPYVEDLKKRYPVPDKQARDYFKRAGINWHSMATFPGWMPDHSPSAVDDKMMVADAMVAFDTKTGEVIWKHQGGDIPNISVTMGDGKMFFVQGQLTDQDKKEALSLKENWIQKGLFEPHEEAKLPMAKKDFRRLVAVDANTGQEHWSHLVDFSGCGGDKLGTAYQDGKLMVFGHYSNHDEGPFTKGSLAWRRITVFDTETGNLVWSKPLNYRRRPLVMGDTIYIEPRACYLATGEIKMRKHPITGLPVPWEFLRPGHSCGIVTASPHSIFYRSFSAAIVNVEKDTGLQLFGGVRPGCWNNLIPGNGLLNFQESSAGCTCSYSIRSTVVLKNKKQKGPGEWSVFITKGAMTPVAHLALNLGAPGDMRDENGMLWFGYPRPKTTVGQGSFRNYGVKFDLQEKGLPGMEVVRRDFRNVHIEGSDRPWLFTSSMRGMTQCRITLIKDQPAATYTIRLGFVAPEADKVGQRVFDVQLQGRAVLENFDIIKEAGGANRAVIKEFTGIKVEGDLALDLLPALENPDSSQVPVIQFIEIVRQDQLAARR